MTLEDLLQELSMLHPSAASAHVEVGSDTFGYGSIRSVQYDQGVVRLHVEKDEDDEED